MAPNQESATVLIVENLIRAANKALQAGELDQATKLLQEAFKESEETFTAGQADEIRPMLKNFSDRMVEQEPPNWPEAQQSLSLLEDLKLQDDQVRIWQRHLALKQAKTLLDQKSVADAFEIFETLIADQGATTGQATLKAEISPIIYESITNLAHEQQWALLSQTVERLELLWESDDELSRLLKTFATAVAQAPENYEAKIAALQTENESGIATLQTELRRRQSWIYALAIILGLTIVAYAIVISLPI